MDTIATALEPAPPGNRSDPHARNRRRPRRRRWLAARGRSLEITKSGWLFIGLTLLVGFAAINSGSNLLHAIFGAMLALIIGSGVLSESTVRRVTARRRLVGPLHAGTPGTLDVEVTGLSPRDVLAVSVEDSDETSPEDGECASTFVVCVRGGETTSTSATIQMPRRGPARLPATVVATRFPFGLFVKRRLVQGEQEILVLPHVHALGDAQLDPPQAGAEEGGHRRARAGDFFGLRAFREGDDPRRIHWPALARLGRPVVREFEAGGQPERFVTLPSGRAGAPAFESAIEHEASRAVALLQRGARVGVRSPAGTGVVLAPSDGAAHRMALLSCLARAGFDEPATDDHRPRGPGSRR